MDRQYQDMVRDEDSMNEQEDDYTIVEICRRLNIQKKKWYDIAGEKDNYQLSEIYVALIQLYGEIDAEQIIDYW